MDTTNSVTSLLKVDSEDYRDLMDTLKLFASLHPEWIPLVAKIERYVDTLVSDLVEPAEPGT